MIGTLRTYSHNDCLISLSTSYLQSIFGNCNSKTASIEASYSVHVVQIQLSDIVGVVVWNLFTNAFAFFSSYLRHSFHQLLSYAVDIFFTNNSSDLLFLHYRLLLTLLELLYTVICDIDYQLKT